MDIHRNTALVDKLAAEYVLAQHAVVRQAVAEWQDRLQPMAEMVPVAAPSESVWPAIEAWLGLAATPQRKKSFWLELREDLSFWRGMGGTGINHRHADPHFVIAEQATRVGRAGYFLCSHA